MSATLSKWMSDAYAKLTDGIELFVAQKVAAGACRAVGTGRTTPFNDAAKMTEVAQLANVLDVNGAAQDDRHIILSAEALLSLRSNKEDLIKADAYGSADFLHTGLLSLPLMGFRFWQSAGLKKHTCELTATTPNKTKGYSVTAAQAAGYTAIGVTGATGAKEIASGCVASFGDDKALYVINEGCTGTGSIKIGKTVLLSTWRKTSR